MIIFHVLDTTRMLILDMDNSSTKYMLPAAVSIKVSISPSFRFKDEHCNSVKFNNELLYMNVVNKHYEC